MKSTIIFPNGVSTTYSYSPTGNPSSISTVNLQQAIINSFLHSFDNVGNKTSTADLAGLHSYAYDPIYQLTQATHPAPQQTEQYSYDPVGNRLGTTVDADNKLLEDDLYTYAYDLNGNRTSRTEKATGTVTTYGYDYENRLISVTYPGMSVQYKYDPFGRRIEKSVNGTITKYFYDGPNIISQYDGSGNVTTGYINGLTIDDQLALIQSGATYCHHKDSLGTVTDLTNSTGTVVESYQYDSFGNIVSMTGSIDQPFTFTGRELDAETGLYYYRARYYDPFAGKFISKDPIGFDGGSINLYSYVENNPANFTDPLGLQFPPGGGPPLPPTGMPGPPPKVPGASNPPLWHKPCGYYSVQICKPKCDSDACYIKANNSSCPKECHYETRYVCNGTIYPRGF